MSYVPDKIADWCRIAMLLTIAGAISATASAADTRTLDCASTIFEPFVIKDGERIFGIDVDALRMIAAELGINVNFRLVPWVRLERQVERGEVDCVAAYFRTSEREAYMDFVATPLHITAYTLFMLEDDVYHLQHLRSFEQIKGKVIGVRRGFKTSPEFEDALERGWLEAKPLDNDRQGFNMLRTLRIDGYLTDRHVGEYLIKKNAYRNIVPLSPPIRSAPAFLVFSKKREHSELARQFDAALRAAIEDGRYQQIFNRYR